MKAFVLLPTGIADLPVEDLDGATPLEAAATPHLDRLAREGRLGIVRQVPAGQAITSPTALLSAFGYDPRREAVGRGGLEAAGLEVALEPDDLAFRVNLASTFRGRLVDAQAGRIGDGEARTLVDALQEQLGGERFRFHAGRGHRHLLVVRGGRDLDVTTVPPQHAVGAQVSACLPTGPDAPLLIELIERAAAVLAAHDVNRVRVDLGENPADLLWPWGPGTAVDLEPFELRTGKRLAVVAGAPLVAGLGRLVGASVPAVPGATGGYDTDYAAKLEAALAALDGHDVVVLHLGAANEACHDGDVHRKVKVLEELDRLVVGPLLGELRRRGDVRLLVTTDHLTSTVAGEGSTEYVPFALWGPGVVAVHAAPFTEARAAAGGLRVEEGHALLEFVLRPTAVASTLESTA